MSDADKNWVDFRVVKDRVTLEMILDHYQINWLRKKKSELVGRCPIHQGDGERTFHVNPDKGAFNCFSCHAHGNVLDFVAAMEKCTVRDAALMIAEWFGIETEKKVGESAPPKTSSAGTPSPKKKTAKPEEPEVINPPLKFYLRVDPDHAYGLGRGLSPETIENFGAGLCLSKGMFAGRYIVPLHNEEGELVGYAGRAIDETDPKYLFPSSEKGFYKSRLLFNLHRLVGESEQPVVVVEGFFDCMKVHQAGFPSVALLGSSLSDEQAKLLAAHFDRAILLLDGDEAGQRGTEEAVLKLSPLMFVKSISLPSGQQPDELGAEDLQAFLAER